MPKVTAAEHEKRITEALKLQIRGATRAELLQHAAAKWGLATRSADQIARQARERLVETAKVDRKEALGEAIEQLRDLYARAFKIQDFRVCLAVRRELSTLLGLHVPYTPDAKPRPKLAPLALLEPGKTKA